ncbi:LYR motif-containing protein 4 [Callorhinchus milii]|uniref:LYR motif-containing protein 4-like protein n=1 Tax=Callorhinchus milii TaxID=7868 RepID=V9L1V2_CALMI|nr:LYR motif-containing protein 4 [Callorhinchus milii]
MAASTRPQVLALYRAMLKESGKFSSYSYRTFAIRKIRDTFRENKNMLNPEGIQVLMDKASENLEIIRRQVLIGHLYEAKKLVVESKELH